MCGDGGVRGGCNRGAEKTVVLTSISAMEKGSASSRGPYMHRTVMVVSGLPTAIKKNQMGPAHGVVVMSLGTPHGQP